MKRFLCLRWLFIAGILTGLCFCAGIQDGRNEQQGNEQREQIDGQQKQEGRDAFALMCGKCHGEDAQGDGPHHWEYRPAPANLTLIRASRVMFVSIVQNGVPGTDMPAFPADASTIESFMGYIESLPPDTSQEWTVPWELGNPRPDIANGESLYVTACIECHGENGNGTGSWARDDRIWPKPARLKDRSSELGRVYHFITEGRQGTMMPPQKGKLSTRARWDLAGFVYTLFDRSSQAQIRVPANGQIRKVENPFSPDDQNAVDQGRETYELYCANCHNAEGKGSFLAPRLIDREWRYGMGADTDLFILVEEGIPGRLMPAHRELGEDRMWEVITYLRHRGGRPAP